MGFMWDVLRDKKQRLESAELRAGILEGYQDAIAGRTTKFSGNLKDDMAKFRKRAPRSNHFVGNPNLSKKA